MTTKPEISFAINKIARKTAQPTKETMGCMKRMLIYLNIGRKDSKRFCHFEKQRNVDLSVFSDASFADVLGDKRKST